MGIFLGKVGWRQDITKAILFKQGINIVSETTFLVKGL